MTPSRLRRVARAEASLSDSDQLHPVDGGAPALIPHPAVTSAKAARQASCQAAAIADNH